MPNPLQLAPNAVGQARPAILYAQVASNQPTPKRSSDPLYIVFPGWRPEYFFRVDDWPEGIHGSSMPQAGAECVIVKDSQGVYRCLYWDGKNSPPFPAPFCNKLASYLLA